MKRRGFLKGAMAAVAGAGITIGSKVARAKQVEDLDTLAPKDLEDYGKETLTLLGDSDGKIRTFPVANSNVCINSVATSVFAPTPVVPVVDVPPVQESREGCSRETLAANAWDRGMMNAGYMWKDGRWKQSDGSPEEIAVPSDEDIAKMRNSIESSSAHVALDTIEKLGDSGEVLKHLDGYANAHYKKRLAEIAAKRKEEDRELIKEVTDLFGL